MTRVVKGVSLHLVKNDFKFSLGKMFVSLENASYGNQNLTKKDQNLPVYKIEIYLIHSLKKYKKHSDLLCHNIMNYLD